MFSVNWLRYFRSYREHFQFSLWWNDHVWLIQADPAGSRCCSSPKSWLSGDEQTEWEWIPAWSVLFLSLSVIVSVSACLVHTHSLSLQTRPLCYDNVTWHRGPGMMCVSYFTLDSVAVTWVWHALYLYNKSIALKGRFKTPFYYWYTCLTVS